MARDFHKCFSLHSQCCELNVAWKKLYISEHTLVFYISVVGVPMLAAAVTVWFLFTVILIHVVLKFQIPI